MSEERLQKIISAAGVASRRAADELLTQRRVEVNGKTVSTLGTKADPHRGETKVAGRRIRQQTLVEGIVREGRQRQVRRMFESIGHPVGRLRRVRIGPIVDEQIPIGHWRDLDEQELAKLRRAARLAPAPHAAATSPPARRKK